MKSKPTYNINCELKELPGNYTLLKAGVPSEAAVPLLERAANDVSKDHKIPGFREGKAPLKAVKSHLGMDLLEAEFCGSGLLDLYNLIIEKYNIDSVGDPTLENFKIADDFSFNFEIKIPVKPRIKLGDYSNLSIVTPKEVTDKEIDARLEALRAENKTYKRIKRGLKEGDFAVLNTEVSIDDTVEPELSSTEQMVEVSPIVLHEKYMEAILGAKKGDVRKTVYVLPKDDDDYSYYSEKTAVYRITVVETMVEQDSVLNDAFAREFGLENLKALREKIRGDLFEESWRNFNQKVLDAVCGTSAEVEIPQEMIIVNYEDRMRDVEAQLQAKNLTMEHYLNGINSDTQKFRDTVMSAVTQDIKESLVLEEIARREGITATDDEIVQWASEHGLLDNEPENEYLVTLDSRDSKELLAGLSDRGLLPSLSKEVTMRKTFEWLVARALSSNGSNGSSAASGKKKKTTTTKKSAKAKA